MAQASAIQARFVQGSTMRHILTMTSTASIGLMAIFIVDLADMYFLSLLGEQAIAAAIGFAGTIAFFTTSVCIAMTIATGVKIARELGEGKSDRAGQSATNTLVVSSALATVVSAVVWFNIEPLLSLLGTQGDTHRYAAAYLQILIPSLPVLALGMAASGALRAIGDAKGAMYCTLAGGLVNAVFDPIFIFGFGWGVEGAAVASVLSRFAVCFVALRGVIWVHRLLAPLNFSKVLADLKPIFAIALPALMTNMATPVAAAFVTRMVAGFGDGYVAGYAVVGRVIPVAFGMIFALSGAVGPVIGQNFGAKRFDRVKSAQNNALLFGGLYTVAACLLVYLLTPWLIALFGLTLNASEVFVFYWSFIAWSYLFLGSQYIANATFNNLGKPIWSTASNWGRVLLGTIPLTLLGAHWWGVMGVLIGEAVGTVLLGGTAFLVSRRLVYRLEREQLASREQSAPVGEPAEPAYDGDNPTAAIAPHSSSAALAGVVVSRGKSR